MNKRILELAEQAGSTHKLSLGVYQFYEDELENFALTIIQECAKVAFEDWCEGTNESSSEMAILKHFGVEE